MMNFPIDCSRRCTKGMSSLSLNSGLGSTSCSWGSSEAPSSLGALSPESASLFLSVNDVDVLVGFSEDVASESPLGDSVHELP